MKNKIGITLFTLYLLQALIPLKWAFLENLQLIETYKKWSGFVLILLVLSQWYLSIRRLNKSFNAVRKELYTNIHKWVGVFLPVALYFHSTSLGFGVLFLLSFTFFLNIAIGFINTNHLLDKYSQYFNLWLVSHLVLSVMVLVLAGVHMWLVFLYN